MLRATIILSALSLSFAVNSDLPTNYEYFTSDGIISGLSADQPYFLLNGKNMTIYSGAIHYFRIPRAYWRDRLRKLRAAGFNTVETYIAWNLHEYQSGVFDFGGGGSEMEDFLYLEEFLKTAQEEDLFAIVRSGPFICAEFEFGGFPSFILRDGDSLVVRKSNELYMNYVSRWFNVLMPVLAKHQFTKGGPIIMFQVENEYALTGYADHAYLSSLRQLMLDNGIVELLVTSDNPWKGVIGTDKDYFFMTGNFDSDPQKNLDDLNALQPGRPVMVMEYWSGLFDYWSKDHQTKSVQTFQSVYESILAYPASVNMYMFIGGTSFGFLNGAENFAFDGWNTDFLPMTNSYDYGAPLAENGDYTDKYWATRKLLAKYNPIKTKLPDPPALANRSLYEFVKMEKQISYGVLLAEASSYRTHNPVSMEKMDINGGSGQSYGYVVYRKRGLNLAKNSYLEIDGRISDTVMVLINGKRVSPILESKADLDGFGTWRTLNSYLLLNSDEDLLNVELDLIVENWGRVNVGDSRQYKGIWQGDIKINNQVVTDWIMYALEFKKSWTNSLKYWEDIPAAKNNSSPILYKGTLNIKGTPGDTYVYTEEWTKGIVMVNGFVLGRYAKMGPQQTLYLPGTLLKEGANDIMLFEQFTAADGVKFVVEPVYNNH
ncbi:unnamed protein product [Ceutorhynchus assimilis]|uniref:Beta-galactosidase n=1 Tax=Ceutorhynchus assimilis TaxID=467358 RepID=A0A9N9QIZ2_9CUCU|nr:unnamed protein product [Ceutorhynchus assimilis]